MIKNYLKIAWRNLIHQKLYSLINISGLAVGLAVCMMIMMYVAHEMSYDRFHKNGNRIFSAHYISKQGANLTMDWTKYNSGQSIKQRQPSVEAYIGTMEYNKPLIVSKSSSPNDKFSEKKLLYADTGFFKFFSFKLISGHADNVLQNPFSVVISKSMAEKYFANDNPVGKTIILKTDSAYTYQVTGVAEDSPSNSSISFNFVASGSSLIRMKEFHSLKVSGHTYLLLKHAGDSTALRRGMQLTLSKEDTTAKFALIPLVNMHLKGFYHNSLQISYLKIFPLIAALILLLALVNYMSLATARATLRAKEVGVRKISGASRKTIAAQFYIESALFTLLSFVLAYILFCLFRPWFLNILELKIDSSFLYSPVVLILLIALLVVTVLLAGSYPALVLSVFKPVTVLKGKMSKNEGGVIVRKVFTILQFTISVALIICGITINRQLYFFRHTDTGINRDNVLMVPTGNSFGNNYQPFYQDIKSMAGVSHVATARRSVFESYSFLMVNDKVMNKDMFISFFDVNPYFIPVLNLQWKIKPLLYTNIAAGSKILINEAAIEKLHLNANPIGSSIQSGSEKYEVAGVLKNFNFASLAGDIQPLAVIVRSDTSKAWNKDGFNLYIKIKAHTNLPNLISNIKSSYSKYDQETPFSYSFMDDDFNKQYRTEDHLASIFSIFTFITVILATLGLFGLAAFTIEQRTKEIGIRKVLGASITGITSLLSMDFLKLVVLAVIIASPIAWWSMQRWLQNFAYRITVGWWIFALAGGIAVFIALITVSFHSVKAAMANPVKSLKSE